MDYRETVFLPKTTMPTKARPNGEETILNNWPDLYQIAHQKNHDGPTFCLHDGPPYANGSIHLGHAMNKILKDMAVRSRLLMGYRAEFRPGWDCHGLPIEWKVEEEWRKTKRDKNNDPKAFRQACRDYAQHWVDHQMSQFKRLGVVADWTNPYLTMDPSSEMTIMSAFHDLVRDNKVFRDNRPTLWSPIERTALSDAETVEREHIVPNIWVEFEITSGTLVGDSARLLVWTTTPWSLVGNAAVAFNPNIQYGLYQCRDTKFVIADTSPDLTDQYVRIRDVDHSELLDQSYRHPLGDDFQNGIVLSADFVKVSSGTGLVHIGPAHSVDDWAVWKTHMGTTPYPNPIHPNGQYGDVPIFAGMSVTKGKKFGPAQDAIVDHLRIVGNLHRVENRPLTVLHSWRSDAVLLMLATPQWFIDLDGSRDRALEMLAETNTNPYSAKVRMRNMIQNRPNWLVSRQRLWGTPLGLFVNSLGEPCRDHNVLKATYAILSERGTEAWFDITTRDVFEPAGRTDWDDWEPVRDVLDVWFDSAQVQRIVGSEHNAISADLVIEGSDQARGWFGSSLWVAALNNDDTAPHRNIMTHGFILDRHGRKMSKSEGNVIDPQKVIEQYGADALRVWVASVDWLNDIKVSDESLRNSAEIARKLRNSLRYIVGALSGYQPSDRVVKLPEIEAYFVEKIHDMDRGEESLTSLLGEQRYTRYLTRLMDFTQMISSQWLDTRKDILYCDGEDSEVRLAYRSSLNLLFDYLVRWIAPIMPFAAEEAWRAMGREGSVHHSGWLAVSDTRNDQLIDRWDDLMNLRSDILAEIEIAKVAGIVKNMSEATITLRSPYGYNRYECDLAQLTNTASVSVVESDRHEILVERSPHHKCDRCWRHVVEDDTGLCNRCESVVGN